MSAVTARLVYGINPGYLLPAMVSIWSVLKHTRRPIDIVIYGQQLGRNDLDVIQRLSDSHENTGSISVESFEEVDCEFMSCIRPLPDSARYPAVSLLPLILPNLIEGRCIFLDADTLIVNDIRELMAIDLKGQPIGACTEVGFVKGPPRPLKTRMFEPLISRARNKNKIALERMLNLGFVPGENYFNSGVMVMECDKIREMPKFVELSKAEGIEPFRSWFPDQDRLNVFFAGQWCQIPLRWNVHPELDRFRRCGERGRIDTSDNFRKQIRDAVNQPMIWHYMGARKPWRMGPMFKFNHSFKEWMATRRECEKNLGLSP